ncbi:hypothetical protein LDP22_32905, partial [Pseudomonas aeruginosa]|nr:hypothetical protein [Pseudomonas aeruginosa]
GELMENRAQLLSRMAVWLDEPSRAFLESVENESPDFGLIGLPQASGLPGVRRKLQNLGQRSAVKRNADRQQLGEALERIVALRAG